MKHKIDHLRRPADQLYIVLNAYLAAITTNFHMLWLRKGESWSLLFPRAFTRAVEIRRPRFQEGSDLAR